LNGVAWPKLCVDKSEAHFFGIGDWGGDNVGGGHTWPNPGIYNRRGGPVEDVDYWAQKYVARQMKSLAATADPDFVLNAGDNFYPGGIETNCGSAMHDNDDPTNQFHKVFNGLYSGPGLSGKPWLSVLGNHDYGGRRYGNAWDAQIFHTWNSAKWRMPAQYWKQSVQYKDFSVDIFMLDSNFMDAHVNGTDPNHNVCEDRRSGPVAPDECWGMTSKNCPQYFQDLWYNSLDWLEKELKSSTARWRIVNTHFPGPAIVGQSRFMALHEKYGLDLVFTGHTHFQTSGESKGLNWIISGGGGGVSSDAHPSTDGHDTAYGFVDFTVSKDELKFDFHSWGGQDGTDIIMGGKTIKPRTSHLEEASMFL